MGRNLSNFIKENIWILPNFICQKANEKVLNINSRDMQIKIIITYPLEWLSLKRLRTKMLSRSRTITRTPISLLVPLFYSSKTASILQPQGFCNCSESSFSRYLHILCHSGLCSNHFFRDLSYHLKEYPSMYILFLSIYHYFT